jgi:hypothetical protein
MFAIVRDDGKLLAVFTKGIELVGEGGLELLAGDVGQLCLCDKRLSFSSNKLLLEDNNGEAVWFLLFQLCYPVRDLLRWLDGGFGVADRLDGNAVLVAAVDELAFGLADFRK